MKSAEQRRDMDHVESEPGGETGAEGLDAERMADAVALAGPTAVAAHEAGGLHDPVAAVELQYGDMDHMGG